jgi:L-galactono-1,4-lactone dehydrogenase
MKSKMTMLMMMTTMGITTTTLFAIGSNVSENNNNHSISAAACEDNSNTEDDDETTDVINWSGTHKVTIANKNYWEPESIEDVEKIVKDCHQRGQTVRPIGSSLSPNGIALNGDGMISMANVDRVLEVDTQNQTITVEAGISVSKVVEALRPYNLTLPNLASIAEQQMGGFIQVGAHGTGKLVSPVDHYVTKLKIVTPGQGTIELTKKDHGRLFELARVGLGCLGVVVEITMECIPAHRLVEHTFVLSRKDAIAQKDDLLRKHKHMRYMWIPYTDAVIVVTNDPSDQVPDDIPRNLNSPGSEDERNKPLTNLLKTLCEEYHKPFSSEDVKGMGFGEIRGTYINLQNQTSFL